MSISAVEPFADGERESQLPVDTNCTHDGGPLNAHGWPTTGTSNAQRGYEHANTWTGESSRYFPAESLGAGAVAVAGWMLRSLGN
jgi:hypothetical protein